VGEGSFGNSEGVEEASGFLSGCLGSLTGGTSPAIFGGVFCKIWPVEVRRKSLVSLEVSCMSQRRVDSVQEGILDLLVAFWHIWNGQAYLVIDGVIKNAIDNRIAIRRVLG